MTRIIGGVAGGRRLRTLPGARTRPTSDRVKEALFSAVQSVIGPLAGLSFLDLYAGSGAVGLEASSRGAARVTLVEKDRRAADVVRDNVRELRLPQIEVRAMAVAKFLAAPAPAAYDVVFSDPPYSLSRREVERDLDALAAGGWLAADAVMVVERSSRDHELTWPTGYVRSEVRRYGETSLTFATWVGYGRADRPLSEEL